MNFQRLLMTAFAVCVMFVLCSCGKTPSEVIVDYYQHWKNQEGADIKAEMYDQIEAKVQMAVIEEFGEKEEGVEDDPEVVKEIQEFEEEVRAAEKKKLEAMSDTDFTRIALERRRSMQGCSAKVDRENIVQTAQGAKAEVDFTVTYTLGGTRRVSEAGYADLVKDKKGRWQIAKLEYGVRPGTKEEESDAEDAEGADDSEE